MLTLRRNTWGYLAAAGHLKKKKQNKQNKQTKKKNSARVESRIEREGAAVQRTSGHTLQAASNNARMHQRRERSQFTRL